MLAESHQVRSTTEKVFRTNDTGGIVAFTSSAWQQVSPTKFYPQERGYYRFRISCAAVQSSNQPVVFRVWSGSGGMGGARGHLVNYFDAQPGEPKVIEFTDFMEPRTSISILPYGLASSQTVHKEGAESWAGPGLAIDWIETEGPLNDTWPPASHRRLLGELKQGPAPIYNYRDRVEVVSGEPRGDAERVLRPFVRRAFRRAVNDVDLQPFLALFEAKLAEQRTFEQALRAALSAVLVSPDFLFLREPPGRLDDFALASRLSYFLWSTMPDEELFALAKNGELRKPGVLETQVKRMLKDPKSKSLAENFAGQWLELRKLKALAPDKGYYPNWDDALRAAMIREDAAA